MFIRKQNHKRGEDYANRPTSSLLIHTDRFIIMIYWLIFVTFNAEMHEHKRKKRDFYRDHNKQSSLNFFFALIHMPPNAHNRTQKNRWKTIENSNVIRTYIHLGDEKA